MQYKIVLFDADETLFDYVQAEAFALSSAFRDIRAECTEAVRDSYQEINRRLWREFEQGSITQSDLRRVRFEWLLAEHRIDCGLSADQFSDLYNPFGKDNPTSLRPTYEIHAIGELLDIVCKTEQSIISDTAGNEGGN